MEKRYSLFILSIIVINLCLSGCKKNKESYQLQNVTGHVQKGPFVNGTSISIFDLQQDLSATGKSFNVQILDNKGTFELNNMPLTSQYASLRADGFYFNEITGQQSIAQITLYALTDITSKTNINVNILTTLEKSRIEYLVKNGKAFGDAKAQAQKEILAIFNITKNDVKSSENMDISSSGEDNAILLAISSIIQGYRTESEMTELISNISSDIREDGFLNSSATSSALINHAVSLDTLSIKANLSKRYSDLGTNASIPNFGKYLTNFITKSNFIITNTVINYPENGLYGTNILALNKTNYVSGSTPQQSGWFGFAALAPKGSKLTIKISGISAVTGMSGWSYAVSFVENWVIQQYNSSNITQIFSINEYGKASNLRMIFNKGTYKIEYFESNSTTPTRQKIINVDL
ncbi:hypothetical protein [Pedobacter aquatilis]|uniref:hypothetical protein n=1 Tax=Pedobacter aquatilis TaxID=351343 RepID=UPI0029316C9E|nr:hypothetical protein [Pedobacter aquatilis]